MSDRTTYLPRIDYKSLDEQLGAANKATLSSAIVNAPFGQKIDMAWLFIGFICLYIVDESTGKIQLIAASGTEQYRLAVEHFNFNLKDYQLDFVTDAPNTIVQAIATKVPQSTTDWVTLNRGETPDETVRLNQANSGIAYTAIYPLEGSVRGAIMYNYYQYQDALGIEQELFMNEYTKLVSERLASSGL